MYKNFTNYLCTPPGCINKFLLVMKLTTVLLIATFVQVSAAGFAQKVTFIKKDATLKQVFNEVYKQTGYSVFWTGTKAKNDLHVDADFKDASLEDVLKKSLENQPLDFTIEDKMIVIKEKEPSFFDNLKNKIKTELAQVTVTGKVNDETGQPLPGVTVKQKGTNNATGTDAKGQYSITVTDNSSVIVFSYIGYETQELAAKDIPNGSAITLKAMQTNLREVVVNKGYYSERRELSTGDVSIVTSKEIQNQPVSDPIQALEGRVPGLDIQQTSGLPGSYAKINIRGFNSILNGNDPLYIVDGVPFSSVSLSSSNIGTNPFGSPNGVVSNGTGTTGGGVGISPFSMISPLDIEDIQVLKDADATAIYGSRGANGVILITTKKGKVGTTKVDLNFQQGVSQVGHFIDLLNTQQYLAMRHEAFKNDGKTFPSISMNPKDNSYDVNGVWDTTRYTNWQKLLIGGAAHYTNAQASISGGNANTQFLIGAGYNRQGSVFPGDGIDQKESLHVNLTHMSADQKFQVQLTAGYVNDDNSLPIVDLTSFITLAPDAPTVYRGDGSINWQLLSGSATWNNPLSYLVTHANASSNNLSSSMNLNYEILPDLKVNSRFGFGRSEMNQTSLYPGASYPPPNNTDPSYRGAYLATTIFQNWIIEPQLTYHKKIARGSLDALVGASYQETTQKSMAESDYGFANDALINNPQAASVFQLQGDYNTEYRYTAFYGRLGYNWDEKYLLNITGRRDGSSRFGPGKQFGNFGAIGVGWIFSKEKFIENNLQFLSFGKLRASYGTTGNDQITPYQYLSTYSSNSSTYQGSTTLIPTSLQNPYLAWETIKKLEAGIDVGFLKERINLSASYYQNRSGNQLVLYPLPNSTGFSYIQYNLPAVVQNKGFELSLNTVNVKGKDFTWNTMAILSSSRNKLISFPGLANSPFVSNFVVGQPTSINRVFQIIGVNPQTGNYTYLTANSNGKPSFPQDLMNFPPLTPKYSGGVENNFKYKSLQLDFFIQYVNTLGVNYIQALGNAAGKFNQNEPTAILSRWQRPGDVTNIGRFSTNPNGNSPSNSYSQSNAKYTDASFVRIKNVALSYSLPTAWQQRAHLQNTRVFLQGQNLLTLTKYVGLDPETQGLSLPPLRTITLGISSSL
jgi:TonB-linked SusC/RagA family outer membrane protein